VRGEGEKKNNKTDILRMRIWTKKETFTKKKIWICERRLFHLFRRLFFSVYHYQLLKKKEDISFYKNSQRIATIYSTFLFYQQMMIEIFMYRDEIEVLRIRSAKPEVLGSIIGNIFSKKMLFRQCGFGLSLICFYKFVGLMLRHVYIFLVELVCFRFDSLFIWLNETINLIH
jgi:hypothetical protein